MLGKITTCAGASRGGMITPSSSPCVMTSPPIMRVEVPQDVVQANCSTPCASRYLISEDFAKFCPRKCEVPACSALPSCIMASIDQVETAPGKRSAADFSPAITGIAM
jgi:hypothetical protein